MLLFKSRWEFIPEGKNVSLGYCYCFLLVLFFVYELFLATSNLIHSSSSFFFSFQSDSRDYSSVAYITHFPYTNNHKCGYVMFRVKTACAVIGKELKTLIYLYLLKYFHLHNIKAHISAEC